jgi:hypothetical protein
MKSLSRLLACVAMICVSVAAIAQITFAGTYSNIRYSGEHDSGYEVQLWKYNGHLYGFLTVANGMIGDTPVGVLDHVTWDAKTGKLVFDAKLTTGYLDDKGKVPAKDLFKFDGVLTARLLSGKLSLLDGYHPDQPPSSVVALRLKLQKEKVDPDHYATPQDLLAANRPMLDNSGPRW